MKKSNITKEVIEKYQEYLKKGERPSGIYRLGGFTGLITASRIILLKKFPQNMISFRRDDIEVAEHISEINWKMLLLGIFSLAFTAVFFGLRESPFFRIIQAEEAAFLIALAFLALSVIGLYRGLCSMGGRLKIMLKHLGRPITTYTFFSEDADNFINHLLSIKVKK